jgi:signal transduction histidine kinase
MAQPFPRIRRNILLASLAAGIILLTFLLLVSPLVVGFDPLAVEQARRNYFFIPVPVMLLALIYAYLAPVARLGRLLRKGDEPPLDMIQQARQVAFNTPAYLFVTVLGVTILAIFLYNLAARLFVPGYEVAPYLSEALLVVATIIGGMLVLCLVVRRQLQPILVTTARLIPPLDGSDRLARKGHRFDVRTRLLSVILVLYFIGYYFPSILAFNIVYQGAQEATLQRHRLWAETVIQEIAPLLDDDALIRHVEGAALADGAQAFIVDGQGGYVTRRPTLQMPLPNLDTQVVEGQILLDLNRSARDWRLGVVYDFHAESDPLVRRTLLLLAGFGLAILALTILSALIVTADVTGELRRITSRLLEVARREEVGEQLPVLSVDEMGDLVLAFNEVQAKVQAQQERLQREHRRLLDLQMISFHISAIFDLDRLLDELVESVRATFGYYNTLVFLLDREKEEFYLAASSRPPTPEAKEARFEIGADGLLGRVASAETPLLIPDVTKYDFRVTSDSQVRSAILTPMLVGGRLVGIFGVESDGVDVLEEHDLQLMTSLANQAAAAVEAARLLRESRANANALGQLALNLMFINRIATVLTSSLDADEILNMTVKQLVDVSGVDYGGALMLERDGQHGLVISEYPIHPFADTRLSFPCWPQQALKLGIPQAFEDVANDPFLEPFEELISELGIRSLLLVPLVARREMIGVLLLAALRQHRAFSDEEMEICQTIASQAAVAVANARLLQDVHQHRRALTLKSQQLSEESSKLDAILNNVADGLVVTDPAGRIILSNPAFRDMAGLPQDHSLDDLLLAGTFPVASLQTLADQALKTPGRVLTQDLDLPDGRVLKTSATAVIIPPPVLGPARGEQIAGVVTVLRDITHEVEVDRMKTDFISAVSHELRSPITAVLGFASLIQRDIRRWISPHFDADADERVQQVVERILGNLIIIEEEGDRLTRLINSVLDIAKMEAVQVEWPMANTNLAGVIESAVAATAALAEEKQLPVRVSLPSDGWPVVWGHRDRLIQVMTNLLSNSLKFTEEGWIEVRGWGLEVQNGKLQAIVPAPADYEVTLPGIEFSEGDWVVVTIADTGVGIPAEDLSRIFDRFTQAGDTLTEKPQGTGLGLAICKEIVEYHGGRIWVESERGEGSAFSFALPVAAPSVGGSGKSEA